MAPSRTPSFCKALSRLPAQRSTA